MGAVFESVKDKTAKLAAWVPLWPKYRKPLILTASTASRKPVEDLRKSIRLRKKKQLMLREFQFLKSLKIW